MAVTASVAAMAIGTGFSAASAAKESQAQRRSATDFANRQTEIMRRQSETNKSALAKIQEEQAKQQELRNKSQSATDRAITENSVQNQNQQIDDKTANRVNAYKTISELLPVDINLGGSKNAPSVVSNSISNAVAKASDKGDQQAAALAAIKALGDVGVSNKISTARTADELGTYARLNNISNVVANAEKNNANNLAQISRSQIENAFTGANAKYAVKRAKASNGKSIGDLLFSVGSMGAGAAGSGPSGGGGSTTTDTSNFGAGGGGPQGGFSPNSAIP